MDDRTKRRALVVAGGAMVAVVGGLVGGLVVQAGSNSADVSAGTGACDSIEVAAEGLPSVVTIAARGEAGSGTGSGEVIRDGGYILTNDHVIAAAAISGTVSVNYHDGSSSEATIVGRDPDTDLAVLQATDGAPDAPVIAIGSSEDVVVGQPVVALGAPLGLSGTVTSGIVSALNRELSLPIGEGQRAQLVGAVQTDASINPGNSGGPLVDCDSQLVGVNSAIATVPNATGVSGGGSVGIGFAIPVDMAVSLSNELIDNGHVSHPTFGFETQLIGPAEASETGLPQGLYVHEVTPGGPAANAGLRAGDVVRVIDGRPATSTDALVRAVLAHAAGDVVDVTYIRAGVTEQAQVTLGDSSG